MNIDRSDRKTVGAVISFCVAFVIMLAWNWRRYSFLTDVAVSLMETITFLIAYAVLSKILPDPK